MKSTEDLFQEFVDGLYTARDDGQFERVATRAAHRLGFRWFAYLRIAENAPQLLSSYPISWTSLYFRRNYQRLDPVILRASTEHNLFSWGVEGSGGPGTKAQRSFLDEAATFSIKSGITVPIRGGFGRMAAFTLASDDPLMRPERLLNNASDIVQLVGLYFHAHLAERLAPMPDLGAVALSQRERQCVAWAARGKTAAETAVLMAVTQRTVVFHLENARRKLGAVSVAHCVALAIRSGLLP